MRLRERLTLLLAVATLLPLMGLGVWSLRAETSFEVERQEEALKRESEQVSATASLWVSSRIEQIVAFARVWDLADRSEERQLGFLRALFTGVPTVASASLVDREGRHLVVPQFRIRDGESVGTTREEALSSASFVRIDEVFQKGVAIGEVVRRTYGPALPIGVLDRDGQAVIIAEISLRDLNTLWSAERGGIVAGNGEWVVGGAALSIPDLQRLRGLGSANFTMSDPDLVGAVDPVDGTDWRVLVLRDSRELLAETRALRVQAAGVLLIVLVSLLGLYLVVDRQISSPLVRLQGAVGAVADGHLDVRAQVQGRDELAGLGLAFNGMAEALQDKQERIDAFQADLQAKIDEATAELRDAQEQLVRTHQLAAIGDVAGGLAHALSNPLAGLLGLIQVLRIEDEADQNLAEMEALAVRCRDVSASLGRVSAAGVDANELPVVNIWECVERGAEAASAAVKASDVMLTVEPHSASLVRADALLAARAVQHLLTAMAAGLGSGGKLHLSLKDHLLVMEANRPFSQREDAWHARAADVWAARYLLSILGANAVEGAARWTIRWAHV